MYDKKRFTMKNQLFLVLFFLTAHFSLEATPSSLFWTVCTTDVYETGIGHTDVDNYFTVFNRRGKGSYFAPDVGLELGLFTISDLSMEAGFDFYGGTDDPLIFNAKIGVKENILFKNAPSASVGIFNVGTRTRAKDRTNQNIVDWIIGKTLPDWIGGGRLFLGVFSGSRAMGKNRQGFMIGYSKSFCEALYCGKTPYFKWQLNCDYASGKNSIGGGSLGIYYFFTPLISIAAGPVFFNDTHFNGKWKWSVQIDISFEVFQPRK